MLEEVLRRDDSRDELRRYVIDLAMSPRLGLFPEAQGHLAVLTSARPNDGELEGLYARCLAAPRSMRRSLRTKGTTNPLRRRSRGPRLVRGIDPTSPGSARFLQGESRHLAAPGSQGRGGCRNRRFTREEWKQPSHLFVDCRVLASVRRTAAAGGGHRPRIAKAQGVVGDTRESAIAKAVTQAQKLAPDELDVLLLAADTARNGAARLIREGKRPEAQALLDQSRALLAHALELHPRSPAAYLATAALEAATRGLEQAIAIVEKGHDAIPDSSVLAIALLDYQIQAGKAADAAKNARDAPHRRIAIDHRRVPTGTHCRGQKQLARGFVDSGKSASRWFARQGIRSASAFAARPMLPASRRGRSPLGGVPAGSPGGIDRPAVGIRDVGDRRGGSKPRSGGRRPGHLSQACRSGAGGVGSGRANSN